MLDKQCVFTITAGRTGTNLLQKLFETFPDTLSLHEGNPNFVQVMRRTQQNPAMGAGFCAAYKIPFISGIPQSRYVETSHLFCKGFVEPFIQQGVIPDVILLRRPPREIALSNLKLDTIPARTGLGMMFLLSPDDPGVLPFPQWQFSHDYQLCYWYSLEIERRQLKYAAMLRELGAKVVETSLSQLLNFEHFCHLATQLGFKADPSDSRLAEQHSAITAQKVNEKVKSAPLISDADCERMEKEVEERISYYEPLLVSKIKQHYQL
jgi:hypothetical protein